MEKSYLMLSLDDEKAKDLADVMGNKTCKKILGILASSERSESDIAKDLSQPMNTIEYNLKKLVSAGLIEKSKDFFWSVKGKKIPVYKLSNKYIVIAPKSSSLAGLKKFIPVVAILGVGAWLVNYITPKAIEKSFENAPTLSTLAKPVTETMAAASNQTFLGWFISTPWAIFLAGSLVALAAYFIIKKFLKGGIK